MEDLTKDLRADYFSDDESDSEGEDDPAAGSSEPKSFDSKMYTLAHKLEMASALYEETAEAAERWKRRQRDSASNDRGHRGVGVLQSCAWRIAPHLLTAIKRGPQRKARVAQDSGSSEMSEADTMTAGMREMLVA